MATIKYNGMELVVEEYRPENPETYEPPKKMLVWSEDLKDFAVLEKVLYVNPRYRFVSVLQDNGHIAVFDHCALIPETPASRMATNRELAKWLAQGNGEVLTLMQTANRNPREMVETAWHYFSGEYNETVDYGFEGQRCKGVRKWGDTEWHTPDVEYMGIAAGSGTRTAQRRTQGTSPGGR